MGSYSQRHLMPLGTLLTAIVLSPGLAQQPASVLTVDRNFPAGTLPPNFITIQAALNYAYTNGNLSCFSDPPVCTPYRIMVHPGDYQEDLLIRGPVTLEGASRDGVRILYDSETPPPSSRNALVLTGRVTLRNLTFVGPDADSQNPENDLSTDSTNVEFQLDFVGGHDDVTVENCRFRNARRGARVKVASDPTRRNDNVVFANNLFENSQTAIELRPDGSTPPARGYVSFTSRGNTALIRGKNDDEGSLAFEIASLDESSTYRSIGDTIDARSDYSVGEGDMNGYMFVNYMPRLSEIVGAQIRLIHLGGRDPAEPQGFAGIKIHSQAPGTEPAPGEMRVVACSGLEIYIEDNSPGAPGGGNAYIVSGAGVDVLVSGGTVAWNVANPATFTRATFSVVGGAVDPEFATGTPHGVFYVGVPIDEIIVGSGGGDGTVTPFDQRQVRATGGLIGETSTVQIDAIAEHLSQEFELTAEGDETISGQWTHTDDLSLDAGGWASPILQLGASGGTWEIFSRNTGGVLELSTTHSATVEVEFDNKGPGNINFRIGRGVFAPIIDSDASLGLSPGPRWLNIAGRKGFFDFSLEVPKSASQPVLTDKQFAIDDSQAGGPRLCAGARGHTWCTPVMTCVDASGCP